MALIINRTPDTENFKTIVSSSGYLVADNMTFSAYVLYYKIPTNHYKVAFKAFQSGLTWPDFQDQYPEEFI